MSGIRGKVFCRPAPAMYSGKVVKVVKRMHRDQRGVEIASIPVL